MVNTAINLFGKEMKNPLILASGVMGMTKSSINYVFKNGAGSATIKSISIEPRKGHNSPTVLTFCQGLINAIGYSNQGYEGALNEYIN